jgi:hypothetical protein
MATPYSFTSSGTSNQRSPWQARQTKTSTTQTAKAADPWSSLATWDSGTKTADLPTYTMPKTPAADTMYASSTPTVATNVTPGAQAGATSGIGSFTPTWANTDWSQLMPKGATKTQLDLVDPKTGIQQWLSAMTPYLQTIQNAYQYAQDFNEAQRRYDATQNWTQSNDLYNQGITGRQQNMAEWQAGETARQWQATQDYQKQRDAAEMALTNTQTMNQVWGRNVAPNIRHMRGW